VAHAAAQALRAVPVQAHLVTMLPTAVTASRVMIAMVDKPGAKVIPTAVSVPAH
jgi:hypothetical protein